MSDGNLYTSFARDGFRHARDRPFLLTPTREPLYYRDLDRVCGRMQSRLIEVGIDPGDRVVVQVEKSPEAVVLYLACLRAGAIYVPLNTAYTPNEVGYFLGDAEPRVFVCAPEDLAALEPVADGLGVPRLLTLDARGHGTLTDGLAALDPEPAITASAATDLAAILYTSGTTGRSKGAMLSHGNLGSNAQVLHDYWHWDDDHDVLLHTLPIFHVHGLFVALHCALLGASPVHFLPRFDAALVIDKLSESTVMMGVPTFYTRMLDTPGFGTAACAGMRLFVAGSAPLPAEVHRAFAARTGHRILERYGMTEAGMIASNPYDGERVAGTVGYPLPGVRARIADAEGNILEPGETGVLEITGPNVFDGYWRMPDKTAIEFRTDGWFVTGDLATMAEDGRITIVGRAKDLIISGGYNIYPKEIENEIDAIDGVGESAVIGVPHPDLGEGVTAVVVPDGTKALDERQILDHLQSRLARFKQPRQIFFVDALPRNTMGKVQKAELRTTHRDTFHAP